MYKQNVKKLIENVKKNIKKCKKKYKKEAVENKKKLKKPKKITLLFFKGTIYLHLPIYLQQGLCVSLIV